MKFSEELAAGTASLDKFHEAVHEWHKAKSGLSVYEYLGITKEDYGILVRYPEKFDVVERKYRDKGKIAGSFIKRVVAQF